MDRLLEDVKNRNGFFDCSMAYRKYLVSQGITNVAQFEEELQRLEESLEEAKTRIKAEHWDKDYERRVLVVQGLASRGYLLFRVDGELDEEILDLKTTEGES